MFWNPKCMYYFMYILYVNIYSIVLNFIQLGWIQISITSWWITEFWTSILYFICVCSTHSDFIIILPVFHIFISKLPILRGKKFRYLICVSQCFNFKYYVILEIFILAISNVFNSHINWGASGGLLLPCLFSIDETEFFLWKWQDPV
jgi:hypothetical protein